MRDTTAAALVLAAVLAGAAPAGAKGMAAAACGGVRWQRLPARRPRRRARRLRGIHPRARPSARRAVPHDPHARARIDRPTVEVYSLDWPRARRTRGYGERA
jgi:hypothetical protein